MGGRRRTDGARILLVEDNEDLRQVMALALEAEGYDVAAVRSAEEGLQLMAAGRFQLVLSDYSLPGRSGAWLLREAVGRRLLQGAATLLVTADPDAPEIGADLEVVPKPVNFGDFLPQIRALLAEGLGPGLPEGLIMDDRSQPIELVLYVSPDSFLCARAVRTMRALLERYDGRQVRFAVRDVTEEPARAAEDRIIFTPTLVKRSPPPAVWVFGDISKPDVVVDLLQIAGVQPAATAR